MGKAGTKVPTLVRVPAGETAWGLAWATIRKARK